jgi:hypothetical protein
VDYLLYATQECRWCGARPLVAQDVAEKLAAIATLMEPIAQLQTENATVTNYVFARRR